MNVALSIVVASAKGQTLNQLLTFLNANTIGDLNSLYSQLVPLILADGSPNGGTLLSFANGVWVEKTFPFKTCFEQVLDVHYKAACKQVDFLNKAVEVVNEANLWARNQTNGLIEKILPVDVDEVNSLSTIIIANALYFKGTWSYKFDESCTEEFDFHLLDGTKVKVPFMTNANNQFIHEYEDFEVLGLPCLQYYDERQFTMYIYLPHAKDGLHSLVDKIGSTSNFLDNHIPFRNVKVKKIFISKFKMAFGFETSDLLKELGLDLPFKNHNDFTEIVDLPTGETLYVSKIYPNSFVEVNEKGTEAAAVSVKLETFRCPMPNPNVPIVDFVTDHPFLFVIREDVTGVVLFIGQVIDPRS